MHLLGTPRGLARTWLTRTEASIKPVHARALNHAPPETHTSWRCPSARTRQSLHTVVSSSSYQGENSVCVTRIGSSLAPTYKPEWKGPCTYISNTLRRPSMHKHKATTQCRYMNTQAQSNAQSQSQSQARAYLNVRGTEGLHIPRTTRSLSQLYVTNTITRARCKCMSTQAQAQAYKHICVRDIEGSRISWTTKYLRRLFEDNNVSEAAISAQYIVLRALRPGDEPQLGLNDLKLPLIRDMRTTDTMAKHIVDMALQRLCGVSVQHCVGVWDFHGIEVLIRPPILVPRPETEELVDWILDSYRPDLAKNTPFRFLDIGAGSGCIGLALLKASNQHRAWGKAIIARAIDINPVAVAMATENAQRLGLDGPYTCTQMSVDDIGTDMATAEVEVNNPIHTGVQETGAARAGTPCSSDHCVGVSSDRSIHMPAYQRSIHMPTYQHVANEENHSADECDRPLNDPSQRQTVDLQRTQGAKHMACNPSYARNTQHTVQTSDKDRVSAGGDVSFSPELCPPVLTTTTRQGLLADDKLGLFHMVVSNPPYIPIADYEGLATEVRDHEDFGALIAGEDGLSVINRILDKADAGLLLLSGGSLYMEVDTTHPALLSERLQSMPSPEYAVGTLAYTEPREDSDIGCLEKYKDVGSNGNSSKNTPGTGLEVEVNLKIETSSWRWPNLRYAETRRDIYGNERFCRIIYGPDLNDAQTIASKK